ncbi:MAG: hypothetical protein ACK4EX_06410 [Thermaurantimonas sp.]|uniref:hypothetical protein n=1 Tax=Thermaurantimonas TaxID=2681566 RepID=UPI0023F2DFE5|nr:hypothetical protein [Thermaurantimonas aggregans]MCX8149779.1 hypothetical protein [Thermaurantimonas aggregans]
MACPLTRRLQRLRQGSGYSNEVEDADKTKSFRQHSLRFRATASLCFACTPRWRVPAVSLTRQRPVAAFKIISFN